MSLPLMKQADGQDPDGREMLRWSTTWYDNAVPIATARTAAAAFLLEAEHQGATSCSDRAVETVQLVVSELVTNARRHAVGPCGLELRLPAGGQVVRITVWDSSADLPVTLEPDAERVGGHGLEIVRRVSRRLAVEPHPAGKQVSAEVDLR